MLVLYPSHPLKNAEADEPWAEEHRVAKACGIKTALFCLDDALAGRLKPKPSLGQESVLYRGWMLRLPEYQLLENEVLKAGGRLQVNSQSYRTAHHLPEWYAKVSVFTANTHITPPREDYREITAGSPVWFVKDYVKSLTTSRGSKATPEEIPEVVGALTKYRGGLEGGLCLREWEEYIAGSERRYFACRGVATSPQGEPPALVQQIAALFPALFISIDVALRDDGVLRLIELGDGQVSERKEWPVDAFVEILKSLQSE